MKEQTRSAKARSSVRVTHEDRVIDSHSGVTKGELAEYYASVSTLILPHLRARPVALLRAPDGVDRPVFFQRHADADEFPGITQLDPALDPGHQPLLAISTQKALLAAVQMNVVEFHAWNATTRGSLDRAQHRGTRDPRRRTLGRLKQCAPDPDRRDEGIAIRPRERQGMSAPARPGEARVVANPKRRVPVPRGAREYAQAWSNVADASEAHAS